MFLLTLNRLMMIAMARAVSAAAIAIPKRVNIHPSIEPGVEVTVENDKINIYRIKHKLKRD